ncbi:Mini-ribonuclease 3 [Pelosinus propionicus]|uniref:Mini-ribonuclease 3 n=1 Tax=Pelosinus propionicus DSM 13327 TaxID=1123291 RepID=A0A1I4NZ23_9FIRM|nr:ribonuclease III domain-containing protein [Pelosinus propionicus]SFM20768.1 ribonuclease-3 family protein [Pelosinus propionicus DSM 13327]
MKFDQFQYLLSNVFQENEGEGPPPIKYKDLPVERLHPLVLAYVGDAYFTLYIRTTLLAYEQNKVRVMHTLDSKIVSATMQAIAYQSLEGQLTEQEMSIVKRGRNAKSTVPKSATVAEYRNSTGFEALLGYLYLGKNYERLSELVEKAFAIIAREMTKDAKKSGEKK